LNCQAKAERVHYFIEEMLSKRLVEFGLQFKELLQKIGLASQAGSQPDFCAELYLA
jgi:hypothetical protein